MSWGKEYREGNAEVAAALNALAEQQRVANIIALARIEPSLAEPLLARVQGTGRGMQRALSADVSAVLGTTSHHKRPTEEA